MKFKNFSGCCLGASQFTHPGYLLLQNHDLVFPICTGLLSVQVSALVTVCLRISSNTMTDPFQSADRLRTRGYTYWIRRGSRCRSGSQESCTSEEREWDV